MKKSINLYFNHAPTKDKLDAIKALNYDEVCIGINDKDETMTWSQQVEYTKQIKLPLTMIHCSYYEPNLNHFWLDDKIGEQVENEYAEQIKQCGKFCNNFVIHLNGSNKSIQTQIGLERIKRLLKICEKTQTNLAIENLYSEQEIKYIFEKLSHPLLKICFDCGHLNCFTKNFKLMEEFGKYVSVLHLHDNNGSKDEHKILGEGTINLENLAKNLKKYSLLTLVAEIKYYNGDYKRILKDNYKALLKLEALIQA